MNIVKLLLIIALFYAGYRIVKMFQRQKAQEVKAFQTGATPARGEDLVQDPYCKTYVPKSQAHMMEIDGEKHFFCGRECCEKFLAEKR